MALHGHTKIELQDVNTGEKKVIEDDNMVTNGLAKLLKPAGGWANIFSTQMFYEDESINKRSMDEYLLGGILCFEQQHEENRENFTRNLQNRIIAKASNYAYTGADTTQGSYNIEESGIQEDGALKKVWDFATNQGNGTIASVSLTTMYAGEIGDGCIESGITIAQSNSNFVISQPYGLNGHNYSYIKTGDFPTFSSVEGDASAGGVVYADYQKNYLVMMDRSRNILYDSKHMDEYFYNSKKLVFTILNYPFSKVSLFTNPLNMKFRGDKIEVPVPDGILSQCVNGINAIGIYADEGYIYFFMRGTPISPGGTFGILKIKAEDFTTEIITITNTSPVTIPIQYNNSYHNYSNCYGGFQGFSGLGMDISNSFFTFQSTYGSDKNGKIYSINLSNSAEIFEYKLGGEEFVPLLDFTPYSSSSSEAKFTNNRLSINRVNGLLFLDGFDSRKGYMGYILNPQNKEAKNIKRGIRNEEIRLFPKETYESSIFEAYGEKHPVRYKIATNDVNNGKRQTIIYPLFLMDTLMTINNLPEPVIKTASQTMKITYTITEE